MLAGGAGGPGHFVGAGGFGDDGDATHTGAGGELVRAKGRLHPSICSNRLTTDCEADATPRKNASVVVSSSSALSAKAFAYSSLNFVDNSRARSLSSRSRCAGLRVDFISSLGQIVALIIAVGLYGSRTPHHCNM